MNEEDKNDILDDENTGGEPEEGTEETPVVPEDPPAETPVEKPKSSILSDIRKMVTGSVDDEFFDTELIIHINSVFSLLWTMGIGPDKTFKIEDTSSSWEEFVKDENALEMVKTYMYYKVKLMFDPPTNSALLQSYADQIKEFEWRMKSFSEDYFVEDTSEKGEEP